MSQNSEVQKRLESIKYVSADKPLVLLDQRVLPHTVKWDDVDTVELTHTCIKEMRVRGAPAIAITAALGLAVAATKKKDEFKTAQDAKDFLLKSLEYIGTSRPTAVNMFNAIKKLNKIVEDAAATGDDASAQSVLKAYVDEAERMLQEDIDFNTGIMKHGADFIENLVRAKFPGDEAQLNIVTICNTGALATARFGTALGVIRELHYRRHLKRVFPLETRPWNQGARLTVFECVHEEIPATLIIDNAVTALMGSKRIHAVIVGADRICRNGDTANKIGTCNVAVVAKHFGVPFFVAAPSTTLDPFTESGDKVEIEQRGFEEITHINGERKIADGPTLDVWNPVFDITSAKLITGGIITEKGVLTPDANGEYDITKIL
jgi:methylthioribose-1-phosphate isomerase